MARQRAIMAGTTDYTGVPLEDMIDHLKDWKDHSDATVRSLREYLARVKENEERLDEPDDIKKYIQYFIDLFTRYSGDFSRLLAELHNGVAQRHVEVVDQVYRSSRMEENVCVSFKRNHIERNLKDESLRFLLDRIYGDTRDALVYCSDLSNLSARLATFVGSSSATAAFTVDDVDAVELKPNVFGIGINLNHLIKRFVRWFKQRKPKTRIEP